MIDTVNRPFPKAVPLPPVLLLRATFEDFQRQVGREHPSNIGMVMKTHSVVENANPSEGIHDPLDAIAAAPKNHKVLYEDDHVRILEVTVQPGEIEPMHHHPCPSVFAHDAPMPKFTNRLADDGSVWELGRNLQLTSSDPELPPEIVTELAHLNTQLDAAMSKGVPMSWVAPPQSTHAVHNLDTFPMHFYRIEFKRVEGNSIVNDRSSFSSQSNSSIKQ